MYDRLMRLGVLAFACPLLACSGDSDEGPTTTVPPTAIVTISSASTQIAWSGAPTNLPACSGSANTWYWDEVFVETAGVAVSLTSRTSVRDGVPQAAASVGISVPAHGSFTNHTVYCFPSAAQHTVQSTFQGTDANGHSITVVGPTITLLAKP